MRLAHPEQLQFLLYIPSLSSKMTRSKVAWVGRVIARRKKKFLHLVELLRKISSNKEDLAAVKELNLKILGLILDDEKRIKHFRNHAQELNRQLKNDRPTREKSQALRKKIEACKRVEAKYLDQIYIWRCFGDALAYTYISSINMRQVFFDTKDYNSKQDAGFISGKDGLPAELNYLLSALEHNVPAVLSDITNTVRYGDICLLGDDDPYPMEVKKGAAANNRRGKRQAATLAKLQDYLDSDVATNFRGQPHSQRVTLETDFVDCVNELNACIDSAYPDGYSIICPEQGLIYAAVRGQFDASLLFDNLQMTKFIAFLVNDGKTNQTWAPFQPFLNTIRNPGHLFDFVTGQLTLLVIVDIDYLCERLTMPGWKVTPIDHPTMMLLFEDENGSTMGSSIQFFQRFPFEFMSFNWYVTERQFAVQAFLENIDAGNGVIIEGEELEKLELTLKGAPRLFESDAQ